MIRPYVAIVRDSFHEAFVSRVLWIVLVLITLVLLALAPLGGVQEAGAYLSDTDLLNREKLMERIATQAKAETPSPGKQIFQMLDPATRASLEQSSEKPGEENRDFLRPRNFTRELREALAKRDFYKKADWEKVVIGAEARKLEKLGIDKLSQEQLARFNRLVFDAAYPDLVVPALPKQVRLSYLHWEVGLALPFAPEELNPRINTFVVGLLAVLLGGGGVFVALLVTASMIPQTFEAGSVDLLLSKPVHRSWLFLAKFFGGCAFIAINAAYFIIGLWLLLGLRIGLWNHSILWAIPLYLFLFAIYYGVSALAGLIWRNAIISVVMAVVFWFVCFLLGTSVTTIEQIALFPRRLVAVTPAGDDLITVNRSEALRWDDKTNDWQTILVGRNDMQLPFMLPLPWIGPVYDPVGERILAFRKSIPGFGPMPGVNRLLIGKRSDGWRRTEGVTVPDGAAGLFVTSKGDVLVAAAGGLFRLEGNIEDKQQDVKVFGMRLPLSQQGARFVPIGPKIQLAPLESAAFDPASGDVTLFDGLRLVRCVRDSNGLYREAGQVTFEKKQVGKVAVGGGKVYLAFGDQLRRYDAQLKPLETIETGVASTPATFVISPDGNHLAIVYLNARLWLYDVKKARESSLPITGRSDVTAAAFDGNRLLVVDRLTRVTTYDLAKSNIEKQRQGAMSVVEKVYRYALRPLYVVFPKPGQLNETVKYVLTPDEEPAALVIMGSKGPGSGGAFTDRTPANGRQVRATGDAVGRTPTVAANYIQLRAGPALS